MEDCYSAEEVGEILHQFEGGLQMRITARIIGANQDREYLRDSNGGLGNGYVGKRK